MSRVAAAACLLFASLGLGACARPALENEPRLVEMQAEADRMDAALDSVEDKLLGNQMRLHLWSELAERHRAVSEVACRTNLAHIESISRHFEKTEEVFRKKRGRRVAQPARHPAGALEEGVGGPE